MTPTLTIASTRMLGALSPLHELLVILELVEGPSGHRWSLVVALHPRSFAVLRVDASRDRHAMRFEANEVHQYLIDEAVGWALDHSRAIPH